ncbi:SDR family NAD(P)-dependent oxidoreductase [Ruegeria lacuscaerulensis]|uniref:SDR family NAD(P)-dependent oxidoreductase n=1 Tax=Ruegeria lacuscaerulensis TaxID=55218 RepID=UPI0014799AC6
MKLLVTGGAGFIGSAVARRAVADGHQVVNLDALTYAACLDNVAEVAGNPNYTFLEADIRDRAAMDRALADHAPDAVMHLAAESHVDRSIDGPGAFIETNVTGTYTLLEAAREYWEGQGRADSFRFHHISTDEVYGSLGPTGQFTEETPYDPRSPYVDLITFVADRPGHDARYAIDPTRIREELNWRPSVSVEEGLEKTVQWYLDNESWWRALQNRDGVGKRLGVKA